MLRGHVDGGRARECHRGTFHGVRSGTLPDHTLRAPENAVAFRNHIGARFRNFKPAPFTPLFAGRYFHTHEALPPVAKPTVADLFEDAALFAYRTQDRLFRNLNRDGHEAYVQAVLDSFGPQANYPTLVATGKDGTTTRTRRWSRASRTWNW